MFGSGDTTVKIKEGRGHMMRGNKALKTSLLTLKFSPDYDIAALEYNQAAQCFQAGKEHDLAVDAFIKVASIREKQNDHFGVGRSCEAAGTSLQQSTKCNDKEVLQLWEKAVGSYRNATKMDTAGRLLLKVAGMYFDKLADFPAAERSYEGCIEIYELDEKLHSQSEVYKVYFSFLCESKQYFKGISILDRHIEVLGRLKQHPSMFKAVLCSMILFLVLGSLDNASKALDDNSTAIEAGFMQSKEYEAGSGVVDAIQEGDDSKLSRALSMQLWKYLPIPVIRLLDKLKPTKSSKSESAANMTSYMSDVSELLC